MPPRVIYIVGSSFSGSTVLGGLLGQHPNSVCAGELGNWTRRKHTDHIFCSCGVAWRDCLFWREVQERWLRDDHPGLPAYRKLQQRYEHMRAAPFLEVERFFSPKDFRLYADVTRNLYQSLAKASGKEIVFDASKRVGRAKALNLISDLDVGYIHLIRDGRGFFYSTIRHDWEKKRKIGKRVMTRTELMILASLEWVMTNRLAEYVITNSKRPAVRLLYEDLTMEPAKSIGMIADAFSLDMGTVQTSLKNGEDIDFGHMWGGNTVRLVGPVKLVPDEKWKSELSPAQRRLFWSLAGSTAYRYGYSRNGTDKR